MGQKLPVEIYREAQEAEKAGDLERAMQLYADSTYFPHATRLAITLGKKEDALKLAKRGNDFYTASRLAIELGKIDEAVNCLRESDNYESANRLAKKYGLQLKFKVGEISNESEDFLDNLAESMYQALVSRIAIRVGFNGLSGNVLDVGCRDGRFFRLLKILGAGEVHGVDLDSDALIDARKKSEVNSANIYDCKVEDLPSRLDGFFDYATIFNFSLGGAEDRKKAVDGIVWTEPLKVAR